MPTLKDIAIRAKVDPSTVSRVVNGGTPGRINPKTRARILAIAADLDYRGNFQARALRSGKTGIIGLLIPETADPMLSQYQYLIGERLQANGLQPFLVRVGWSESTARTQIELLRQGIVDGMIVLSANRELVPLYDELREQGVAVTLRVPHRGGFERYPGSVLVDVAEGYSRIVGHVARSGRRRIGVIGGRVAMEVAAGTRERAAARAFAEAFEHNGLALDPNLSFPVTRSVEDHLPMSDDIAAWLRETSPRLDGLVVSSHRELLAIWRAIRICGLSVPQDLAVACLGDSDLTRLWEPSTTVWDLPIARTCEALVDGLLKQLNRGKAAAELPKQVQTRGRLITRASTAEAHPA